MVRRALAEPLRWIAINAGYDGDEVVEVVAELPLGHGFNALTGEYGDMFDEGVIDPFKVTRAALESAASIAALLITTETAVVEEVVGNPGAIMAPGFGDLAEGMVRPVEHLLTAGRRMSTDGGPAAGVCQCETCVTLLPRTLDYDRGGARYGRSQRAKDGPACIDSAPTRYDVRESGFSTTTIRATSSANRSRSRGVVPKRCRSRPTASTCSSCVSRTWTARW